MRILARFCGLGRTILLLLLLSAGWTTGFRSPYRPAECLLPSSLSAQPAAGGNSATNAPSGVRFRTGRPDDEPTIAFCMAKELMNPLGISSRNFVVAEDASTGDRLGWAQIRPLGPAAADPEVLDSPPGSMPYVATAEDDVDEIMWEEFEEDPDADLATWKSTLPWSKEYKAAMEAAQRRQGRRAELLAEEKAKRQNTVVPMLWELASVYVIPERRSEGIGRALVRSVLDQHRDLGRAREAVYALTLSSTVEWYAQNFGFVSVDDPKDIPKPMAFEVAAGTAITKLMGNQLVCLRLPLEVMA